MKANILNDFTGFTLLELMIVILIVAIFSGIAAPSFNNQYKKSVAKSHRDILFQDLQFARSESITRSTPVTICQANPKKSQTCNSGVWNEGWIIFHDANGNGKIDDLEKIISSHYSTNDVEFFKQSNTSKFITFLPDGKARFNGEKLTYNFCYLSGKRSADVTIDDGGQVQFGIFGDGAGERAFDPQ